MGELLLKRGSERAQVKSTTGNPQRPCRRRTRPRHGASARTFTAHELVREGADSRHRAVVRRCRARACAVTGDERRTERARWVHRGARDRTAEHRVEADGGRRLRSPPPRQRRGCRLRRPRSVSAREQCGERDHGERRDECPHERAGYVRTDNLPGDEEARRTGTLLPDLGCATVMVP